MYVFRYGKYLIKTQKKHILRNFLCNKQTCTSVGLLLAINETPNTLGREHPKAEKRGGVNMCSPSALEKVWLLSILCSSVLV